MKFPISVMQVDNTIFLLQSKITKEFKRKLDDLNEDISYDYNLEFEFVNEYDDLETFRITFNDNPSLTAYKIYINGTSSSKDYKIKSFALTDEHDFDHLSVFQNAIKHYANLMGYIE